MRKIIHIDMDAFYASVEQRDNPAYQGKPLVVGGSPQQRGAVAAASYEARKFGIHSAMPSRTASLRCPSLVFVKPRFEVYRAVSAQIHEIFYRYTDQVEPLALDEAYLDVTHNKVGLPSATWIAQEIQQAILAETQLTASAGISVTKFLAKIASGIRKPHGLYVIPPEQAEPFVEQLPIAQFHGIGQVTATKMHQLGIFCGADLKQWAVADLVGQFGKVGHRYYQLARAQDDRLVQPNRLRKSIGAETSFDPDLSDRDQIRRQLAAIGQTLQQRIERQQAKGRTLTLKVKYADYQQITRSKTLVEPIGEIEAILELADELLVHMATGDRPVRLLGLCLSNLEGDRPFESYTQLTLAF